MSLFLSDTLRGPRKKWLLFIIYILLFLSDTSREPRKGEEHGKGYFFDTRENMEADIKEGKFLEFGEFNGNLYGTKLESIHYTVQQGKMCVLDVNPTVSLSCHTYCNKNM